MGVSPCFGTPLCYICTQIVKAGYYYLIKKIMNGEELKEILKLLTEAGMKPMLCDTPIPVYESLQAGAPEEPGQAPKMVLVPKAFLSMYRESMVERMNEDR